MQFWWKNHVSFCWNIMDGPLANLWRGGWGGGFGVEVNIFMQGKRYWRSERNKNEKKKKNSCSSNFLHPAITFLMV